MSKYTKERSALQISNYFRCFVFWLPFSETENVQKCQFARIHWKGAEPASQFLLEKPLREHSRSLVKALTNCTDPLAHKSTKSSLTAITHVVQIATNGYTVTKKKKAISESNPYGKMQVLQSYVLLPLKGFGNLQRPRIVLVRITSMIKFNEES